MIFPIGDEQVQGGHKPLIAYLFIGLNVLVFLFQVTMPGGHQQGFVNTYGMIPVEIRQGDDLYTMLTNMFLHGGWMHLIGNMLFLWVFADNIEAVVGKWRFILFYFGGGIFASLIHLLFNLHSAIPAIGASGAISAVLGAYIVMFPASKVKVWVLYLFRSFYIPAIYFLGFWAIQQFFNGFISIVPSSAFTSDIAWWAHIGGFVFGLSAGFVIRRQYEPHAVPHKIHSPKDFV
jgi:membrane associated rhomboid family serine protease